MSGDDGKKGGVPEGFGPSPLMKLAQDWLMLEAVRRNDEAIINAFKVPGSVLRAGRDLVPPPRRKLMLPLPVKDRHAIFARMSDRFGGAVRRWVRAEGYAFPTQWLSVRLPCPFCHGPSALAVFDDRPVGRGDVMSVVNLDLHAEDCFLFEVRIYAGVCGRCGVGQWLEPGFRPSDGEANGRVD